MILNLVLPENRQRYGEENIKAVVEAFRLLGLEGPGKTNPEDVRFVPTIYAIREDVDEDEPQPPPTLYVDENEPLSLYPDIWIGEGRTIDYADVFFLEQTSENDLRFRIDITIKWKDPDRKVTLKAVAKCSGIAPFAVHRCPDPEWGIPNAVWTKEDVKVYLAEGP